MIAQDRIACGNILVDGLCHCRRQVDTSMGALILIDRSAEGLSPVRVVKTDPTVERHPVGNRSRVSLTF